ncbi:HlyD family efflux transporter periplasmic adaptor subunit [uncultured Thiodictyon sp.]|uniref:HlyD family secretion protein n=1 Tax=uncultured Thiodictyon sp. TaxID=1846217 RepID=UPI0025E04EBC|nr:HlyD family efflux transporter periplasmic adaptor subunit [uncultured Thiodictyon sp.]
MAVSFGRTWRALAADSSGPRTLGLGLAGLLLAAWFAWFLGGHVRVYEVSSKTSLEAAAAAHPIATRIEGRVLNTHLELGRRVVVGEVLVELDAEAERIALAQSEGRLVSLKVQADQLRPEIGAREAALTALRNVKTLRVAESRANAQEAITQTHFAESQAASRRRLAGRQFVTQELVQEAETKVEAGQASVRARDANTGRLEQEAEVEIADRRAAIFDLQRQLANLEGQVQAAEADDRAIRQRIELHAIRAPMAGRLGRVEALHNGAVVQAGQVLGAVVPDGALHAEAWFGSAAVGRIRSGQAARLLLDAFPWTQYGTVSATVESVGNDPLGGQVRVELALDGASAPAIPLGHGLSGITEIEVERTSPARLVLRAVGRWLTTRRGTPDAGGTTADSGTH